MKNEQLINVTENSQATRFNPKPARFLTTATTCTERRTRRVHVPLPRHEHCVTKRHLIAALRQAELSDWLASGGDYLSSMHQPVY
jgi:hypothetical protein